MKIFLMETANGTKVALFTELEMPLKMAPAKAVPAIEYADEKCADSAHLKEKKGWRWPWKRGEEK